MRLCILVFKSLLALGAFEFVFVQKFHYKLIHLGRSGRLAAGWAGFVLLRPRRQTRAAVESVTRGALFGVDSYQKANGTSEVLVKRFNSLRWLDSDGLRLGFVVCQKLLNEGRVGCEL